MVPTGLEERVRSLEETSQLMRNVPIRLDRMKRAWTVKRAWTICSCRFCEPREELLVAIGATADGLRVELRGEMHAMRDELRTEMYAIRDQLRAEIRAGNEETRRHMGVLLEHAVAQMHALFDASRRPPQ